MEIKGSKKMGVLVGCNYPNTSNALHGCINDVVAMRHTLVNRFGFDPNYVKLLTDDGPAGSNLVMPTGENIKKALNAMVDEAEPSDILFFHYSGHGTRIPSLKPYDPLRHDEAIVPCDFNLITDVDFRHLVNRLPKGASFTILSDSCHSGGLIDKEKEQIGPSSANVETGGTTTTTLSFRPKIIPFESLLQHFTSLTNINTLDIGTHLLETFGANASLKFRLPSFDFELVEPRKSDGGILLSGCQANETSADMSPNMEEAKAYGAFSNAVQMVLKEHSSQTLSNKQVVMEARKVLKTQGFDQHPCLYCTDENADAAFL
ncbi:hypothetical protein FNV43_RR15274 [Rhamnella rubrinervis]|uniref:Peptidase C14 caspase domain-containing protein n=1 Tax=Rhamnella rubrinervis TaxID=2594499 RepID=A0A8K0E8R1_9ROSA|nr:hypothetical protein FNV43_RR15274 [Rhamnella rubrinervis]